MIRANTTKNARLTRADLYLLIEVLSFMELDADENIEIYKMYDRLRQRILEWEKEMGLKK